MSDERVYLTADQAEAMLPDGNRIHTFRQSVAGVLIGADWDRSSILALLGTYTPELSGEQATAMKHGLCLQDNTGWLFIATRPNEQVELVPTCGEEETLS